MLMTLATLFLFFFPHHCNESHEIKYEQQRANATQLISFQVSYTKQHNIPLDLKGQHIIIYVSMVEDARWIGDESREY
jgi:hypothetical protein